MASTIGRGPFDGAIIAGFANNLSAEEVSSNPPVNGALTPEQCLLRKTQLISAKGDAMDAQEKLALLLEDIYYLRGKLRGQMDKADYIDKDSAAVWLKTIDAAINRVDKVNVGLEDAVVRMQEMHARVMAQAIHVGFEKAIMELQKRYEIPREEAYLVLSEALPLAIESVEAEVAGG